MPVFWPSIQHHHTTTESIEVAECRPAAAGAEGGGEGDTGGGGQAGQIE